MVSSNRAEVKLANLDPKTSPPGIIILDILRSGGFLEVPGSTELADACKWTLWRVDLERAVRRTSVPRLLPRTLARYETFYLYRFHRFSPIYR